MKKKYKILTFLFGIAILAMLVNIVGVNSLLQTLLGANTFWIAVGGVFSIFNVVLGVLSLNVLLSAMNKSLNFGKLLKYYVPCQVLGMIMPAKLGEFSILYFLKKHGISPETGSAVMILDKAITLCTGALISIIGIILLHNSSMKNILILSLSVIAISIAILLLFVNNNCRNMLKNLFENLFKARFRRIKNFFLNIKQILSCKKSVIYNIFLTFLRFAATTATFYFIFLAIGENINAALLFFILALSLVVTAIPVSIFGVKESIIAGIFVLFGIDAVKSALAVLLVLFLKIMTFLLLYIYSALSAKSDV